MRTRSLSLNLFVVLSLMVLLAVSVFFTSPQAHAQGQQVSNQGNGITVPHNVAKRIVLPGGEKASALMKAQSSLVDTIPFWSSVFTAQGSPFPFQMVGTDPTAGSHTTVVPTAIIPLDLTFSNGVTLRGSSKVQATLASPIFQKAAFTSGTTQYGDAIQRASFWKYVSTSSKNYHVLLGTPHVFPTVNLDVPANVGRQFPSLTTGVAVGTINVDWFDSQLQSLLTQLHISPKTFPIFLDYNTALSIPTVCDACALGYHNALFSTDALGRSVIQTYAATIYNDPGTFFNTQDITVLSHEVSEWYNDPFIDNITPGWGIPGFPPSVCGHILEVGDPVSNVSFFVNGYHPEDETFFSWFAKQVPSIGINGQYTYRGTFTSPSPNC